jgi:hypothetical protein
VHGFVESHDRTEADLKLALDNIGTMFHNANADREGQPSDRFQKKENIMTVKYQIHGYDKYVSGDYIEPTLYDTYAEAHARAHSNHEWVVKVEVADAE